MSKQFCPTCGNNTLIKTSCSIDENGVLHYHLKKNFQYRLKGTKVCLLFPACTTASLKDFPSLVFHPRYEGREAQHRSDSEGGPEGV